MQHKPYREVPLYRRNGSVVAVAVVDSECYEEAAAHRWALDDKGYAFRMVTRSDGHHERVLLHRFLLGLSYGDGIEADHINRNRLDNRLANLRTCTRSFNAQNKGGSRTRGGKPVTSRFACVYRDSGENRWRARTVLFGVRRSLGRFPTELEAALAVERWRREHKPWTLADPALIEALEEYRVNARGGMPS